MADPDPANHRLRRALTSRRLLWLALVVGAALRLAYALAAGPGFSFPDEAAFQASVATTDAKVAWTNDQTREPLYPAFLAAIYRIAGTPRPGAIRIVQALLSTATIGLVFLLARELFGPVTAGIAAVVTAGYPFFIYYCAYLLRETLLVFLAVALCLFTVQAIRRRDARAFVAASLTAAAAVLAKVTFLPFWGLTVILLALTRNIPRRALLLGLLVFATPLVVVASSHQARYGAFFLVRGLGFNAYAPLILPKNVYGTPAELTLSYQDPTYAAGRALPIGEQDAFFMRAVLREVRERPGLFLDRTLWRLGKFWRIWPHRGVEYTQNWRLLFWVSLLSYGALLPLALWTAGSRLRELKAIFPLYLLPAVFSLLHALTWSQIRYRLPLEPLVIVFAAEALRSLSDRLRHQREPAAAAPADRLTRRNPGDRFTHEGRRFLQPALAAAQFKRGGESP